MEDNTFLIYENDETGTTLVSEEVVASIAGIAASEVEGVASLANGAFGESIPKLGRKKMSYGVKVVNSNGKINVILYLIVKMGCNIPNVCANVQANVRSALEGMFDTKIGNINIEIVSMKIE